jgi:hypothetical protein
MNNKQYNINRLHQIAQFVLFVTSYIPLFILICLKQCYENRVFLHWGGFEKSAIYTYVQKFGLTTVLMLISLFGIVGCVFIFKNLEKDSKNGDNVTVTKVSNRNSESIGYIATYIVPFLFQGFNNWYEIFALGFLLLIIYRIYINSTLLIINPLLSFRYSVYEVEYEITNKKIKNALIITRYKDLNEGNILKIYQIGHKLYYAVLRK